MKDKTLDKAFKDFWQEASYKKPNYSKQIKPVNTKKVTNPNVGRIKQTYSPQKQIPIRSLPNQRQCYSKQDYYSEKTRKLNQSADYLLAQKRLLLARQQARAAGYRSPSEKVLETAGRTSQRVVSDIGQRINISKKTSGLKDKVKGFFKKSIYD